MTDEQVQQIVDALKGDPGDSTATVVVTLLAVVIGFALSQIGEWVKDRRTQRRLKTNERTALVVAALETTYLIGASTANGLRADSPTPRVAGRMAAFQGFGPDGVLVAGWWTEQMRRLAHLPDGLQDFTPEQQAERMTIGRETMKRLQMWERGKLPASWFRSELRDQRASAAKDTDSAV